MKFFYTVCAIKIRPIMASNYMNVNNNTFNCCMCGKYFNNGFIHSGLSFCTNDCFQNKRLIDALSSPRKVHFGGITPTPTSSSMHASSKPTASTKPSCPSYGTCSSCTNTYGSCSTAVQQNGKWFCGKTCCAMYASSQRMAQFPAPVAFPYASNMATVFPLNVTNKGGVVKLTF